VRKFEHLRDDVLRRWLIANVRRTQSGLLASGRDGSDDDGECDA
jgi:hypothetical protein